MYETVVTVVGTVVTPIDSHRLPDGTTVANFRVGSTQRRYDRATGGWVDGDKLYVDVKCWRDLADNTMASLGKGDPVVVTGRLYTRSYEHEGQRRQAMTLEAHSVAADLTWCTAVVTRTRRRVTAASADAGTQTGERDHADAAGGVAVEPVGEHGGGAAGDELVGAAPGGEG
jgi:single-strand DNA-binding protein